MSDNGHNDYESDNDDIETIIDDSDTREEEYDILDQMDISAKLAEKTVQDIDDGDINDNEIEIVVKTKKSKEKFYSVSKITRSEQVDIITHLAEAIANSKLLVPKMENEDLLKTKNGNSIEMAFLWFQNRKIYPIPCKIFRSELGFEKQILNPNDMKTEFDYDFEGFDW